MEALESNAWWTGRGPGRWLVNETDRRRVGSLVRSFYEAVPFPDVPMERISSFAELEARAGLYVKMLNTHLPKSASVIDLGCGTGMLLCFLAQLRQRELIGVDFSLNSLRQGRQLASVLGLGNVTLVQADLFSLPFKSASFDYVICHGVLHHTADPLSGLKEAARLLKQDGFLSLGLYNRYGRAMHGLRRFLWRKGLAPRRVPPDGFYREDGHAAPRATLESWFKDQYEHPHETTVSLCQVGEWLSATGLRLVRHLPGALRRGTMPEDGPFASAKANGSPCSLVNRCITQAAWMLRPSESGYFITIARK